MKLKINDNSAFDCPEGQWLGKVVRAVAPKKPTPIGCSEQVRITWEIEIDGLTYLVAKNYCADLRTGSVLREELDTWFEQDLSFLKDENGFIDLDNLEGQTADLLITHIYKGQRKPFVDVTGVYKPGRLIAS